MEEIIQSLKVVAIELHRTSWILKELFYLSERLNTDFMLSKILSL